MSKVTLHFEDEHQELVRRLWLRSDTSQYLLKRLLKASKPSARRELIIELFQNEKKFAIELLRLEPQANELS